jgi:hypothetical protein
MRGLCWELIARDLPYDLSVHQEGNRAWTWVTEQRYSLIPTPMRPSSTTTNRYRNIHMPSADPGSNASGEGPEPSIVQVRCDLLADHGLQAPGRGTPRTAALYKFIDGEQLSPRDSLELSRWLEAAGPQNVELLEAMQGLDPSVVPR